METGGRKFVSAREFGRQVGVSHVAVLKGIKNGRLLASLAVGLDGKPAIVDAELARHEWFANAGQARNSGGAAAARAGDEPPVTPVPDAPLPPDNPLGDTELLGDEAGESEEVTDFTTLNGAQRLVTLERARKLRLENEIKRGRLVDVSTAAKEAFEAERIIRESILNLPARLSGELAAETDAGRVYAKLDAALRQALNDAADALIGRERA
jgi:hypothetical protein